MRVDEQSLLCVADAFNSAAFTGDWLGALGALSSATSSRIGQLVGLGTANAVPFNWVTEMGLDYLEDFLAVDGGNPDVNPFVRAGIKLKPLKVLASADFITQHERRSSMFIAEHSVRHDLHHICLTPLIKEGSMAVGLAVIRSASQGEVDAKQRAAFIAIAPHARSAVQTQIALEHQGAKLIAGTLEALSLTAFICDRQGRVNAMTPSAESMLRDGNILKLKNGFLTSLRYQETRTLTDTILQATGGQPKLDAPVSNTVLIRNQKAQICVLQVITLPRSNLTFGYEPRALVVVRDGKPDVSCIRLLLNTAYALTTAETDVAIRLADGLSPEKIASERKASIGTVRVQIRSIYEKFEVNRIGELAAKVNKLR